MATRSKIHHILLSMAALPNAPKLQEDTVNDYFDILGHWGDDVLDAATLHYKSTETFFPTPGTLNNKVLDMQMLAMGVPTAAEAWSQVLSAIKYIPPVYCADASKWRNDAEMANRAYDGAAYNVAMDKINRHRDCTQCKANGFQEVYSHPVVAETVNLLGGREKLMTDNAAADRKQFIDAYRERVNIEGRKFIMPPQVRGYIETQRQAQLGTVAQIKQLTKGMEK